MDSLDLSQYRWQLSPQDAQGNPDWANSIDARVPGSIVDDLLRANAIPDPYHAENFREVAWTGEKRFWYRTYIDLADWTGELDAQDETVIRFDGIDTYAEVFWNGVSLGTGDNQFVRHYFTIAPERLVTGQNELVVRIDPVKDAFRKWFDTVRPDTAGTWALFDADRPWIRKAQMTFGWDNCPSLVAGGITLPVYLERKPARRFEAVEWTVKELCASGRRCLLALRGSVSEPHTMRKIRVSGRCGESNWQGTASVDNNGCWQLAIGIDEPRLWWPNGAGAADLYAVRLTAHDEHGSTAASRSLQIGLRQVKVITGPPETRQVDYRIGRPAPDGARDDPAMDGACLGPWERTPLETPETVEMRPFQFEVNGRRLFVKGFDWQTPDALVGTVTDERIHSIIDATVKAGANMLRAWGGGALERDCFYRLCDEKGLMLWQDFFFACAIYPRDPAFLRRIEPEVEDIIRRLRNHTCLVAWCGDNESDMIEHDSGGDPSRNPINKKLIPDALARLDWQGRHYHCSSPSGGPYPRSDFSGDKRSWGPNFPHDNYRHIRQEAARFISESGMKSFPSQEAIARAIPEASRWPIDNAAWRLHWGDLDNTVRGDYRLDAECVRFFGEANSLDARIELSQFAQAYGTRLLIEQCRRRKKECGGILIWKTADQWPGCDQGIHDYAGVLRPVYAAIRDAFAPVIVSISQGFGPTGDDIEWWLLSDSEYPVRGSFTGSALSLASGHTKKLFTLELELDPDQGKRAFALPIKNFNRQEDILIGHFQADDRSTPLRNWYALEPRTAFLYARQNHS